MINKHTAIDRKTRTLGTKVSEEVYYDFQDSAAKLNLTESQLLRLIINKFLEMSVIKRGFLDMAILAQRKELKRTLGAKVNSSVYEELLEFSLSSSISAGALLRLLVIHFLENQHGNTNGTVLQSGPSYSQRSLNFQASFSKELSFIRFVSRLKKPANMTEIQIICFRYVESAEVSMVVSHLLGVLSLLLTSDNRKIG